MNEQRQPIPVAVLGATGAVGQRFLQLLDAHPWFVATELVASERSAGRPYREAAHWLLPTALPEAVAEMTVLAAGEPLTSRLVFSALDKASAETYEPLYAERGHLVVSNASFFRMDPRVPLLVPEINPEAIALLERQEWAAAGGGILTNPNCSVVGLAMALAPLERVFGLEAVTVVTLQALSGAGYPGVPALDAVGNVVPHIGGEEEKIAEEPCKILGVDFPVSVAVHRVPVADGHSEAVFVKLGRRRGAERPSIDEIRAVLAEFRGEPQERGLPSAPERPIEVLDAPDRPQPARDADRGGGMTVSVGRLRPDPVYDVRFNLLVHNTLRGAAGAAILNAELLAARGLLEQTVAAEAVR